MVASETFPTLRCITLTTRGGGGLKLCMLFCIFPFFLQLEVRKAKDMLNNEYTNWSSGPSKYVVVFVAVFSKEYISEIIDRVDENTREKKTHLFLLGLDFVAQIVVDFVQLVLNFLGLLLTLVNLFEQPWLHTKKQNNTIIRIIVPTQAFFASCN